jgi:uncharacterized protein YegL
VTLMSTKMDEMRIRNNNAERTPCVLVLDISGSMEDPATGTKHRRIDELNEGIKVLHQSLRADPDAVRRVEIAVVTVGGPQNAATLAAEFSTVDYFDPPVFEAGGGTPLGEGVITALEALDARRRLLIKFGRAISRPWMIVMSDGEPTDDENRWQLAVDRARSAARERRCLVYPVLIEGARGPRLAELADTGAKTLRAVEFADFFRWVSVTVSRPIRSDKDAPNPGRSGDFSKAPSGGGNVRPLR